MSNLRRCCLSLFCALAAAPAQAACDSSQLRSYMSKGFSVVFRLYDTTGNLRVTYAPVNIEACRK